MKSRTISLVAAFTVLLFLNAAVPTLAQESVLAPNVIVIAHPRAGIVNLTQGGAENFLLGSSTAENPLASPEAGHKVRLQENFEAVFFPRAIGWATFEMAVYETDEAGNRILIGQSKKHKVGVGPQVKSGSLHVDVRFDEPGIHQITVVATTTTQPLLAAGPVVDEDQMTAFIIVPGDLIAGNILVPVPMTPDLPGLRLSPLADRRATLDDPLPDVNTRLVQVASPRGHIVALTVGAAENFDLGHGGTVTVRQGGTVRFRSGPYELVWYEDATASAFTSLDILGVNSDGTQPSLGRGEARFDGVTGPYRERGTLDVDVVFNSVGTFKVLARVRTAVLTPADAATDGVMDQDDVEIRVKVVLAPEVGAIAGAVTAEDTSIPLSGVPVRAFDVENGRLAGEGHSNDDGSYLIQDLPAGRYLVQAVPQEQNYLPEFYDDARTREDAMPVEVRVNETTGHIDFALTPGGTISGKITREGDGLALGNVVVRIGEFESNRLVGTARSLDDGTYAVDHLPAGRYWVHAGGSRQDLVPEYYDDAPTLDEADPVDVEAGHETPDIDFALVQGGSLSGHVVADSPGPLPVIRPLPGIKVEAAHWESGEVLGRGETGPNGRYDIRSLPQGSYRVRAYDEQGRYVAEYYDNVTNPADATPVLVEPGEDTPNINFALRATGDTLVRIEPPACSTLMVFGPFTVTVVIEAVQNLGSFDLEMTYDPKVLHVDEVQLGDFLGSTGRTALPLGPEIDNDAGWMHFGGFSMGAEPGADGSGVLAIITLSPQGTGSTTLHLQNVQLTRPDATIIPTRTRDGQVQVDECIFGDFDCDCDVDNEDVMKVATRWGTREGDPDYDPTYDLDKDGDIDNVDVQLVANAWGTTCDKQADVYTSERPRGRFSPNALSVAAAPSATNMWLVPALAEPSVGGSLTLQVMIGGAVDLGSFQFEISFDPRIMQAQSARLGSFLGGGGGVTIPLGPEIDNEAGSLTFGGFLLGQGAGVSGSGLLAEVTFSIVGVGQSAVELPHAQTTDSLGQPQGSIATQGAAVNAEAGSMTYLPFVVKTSS